MNYSAQSGIEYAVESKNGLSDFEHAMENSRISHAEGEQRRREAMEREVRAQLEAEFKDKLSDVEQAMRNSRISHEEGEARRYEEQKREFRAQLARLAIHRQNVIDTIDLDKNQRLSDKIQLAQLAHFRARNEFLESIADVERAIAEAKADQEN